MKTGEVLADAELKSEIMDKLRTGVLPTPFRPSVGNDRIMAIVESPPANGFGSSEEEAIILVFGRPALLVRQNSFDPPASETWRNRLEGAREAIESAIPSVGRIEVRNHPSFEWLGTGWVVSPDIVITNRHVAEEFAKSDGAKFVYRRNFKGRDLSARIDFREEFMQPEEFEFNVTDILYVAGPDDADVALLRVEGGEGFPDPIRLSSHNAAGDEDVVVIGYPAEDGFRNDPPVMKRIFGDIYDVKRLQPGKIRTASDTLLTHDCSTLGGNSGSVVLALDSGEALGLHFAGKYKDANYAVTAPVVRDLLSRYS